MKFNVEQTSNEELARMVTGSDTDAVHVVMANGESAEKEILNRKAEKFNEQVNELQERFQEQIDVIEEAGKKIAADLKNIEIMPLTSYVLISPFKTNPFQQIKTDSSSGLITDLGGLVPTYKSQETGEIEEEMQYVKVGMVVETGTDCKFIKEGDIVIYNIASEVQVPFFKFGFVVCAEQRIIAVVNEKLTERKIEIMNKMKSE